MLGFVNIAGSWLRLRTVLQRSQRALGFHPPTIRSALFAGFAKSLASIRSISAAASSRSRGVALDISARAGAVNPRAARRRQYPSIAAAEKLLPGRALLYNLPASRDSRKILRSFFGPTLSMSRRTSDFAKEKIGNSLWCPCVIRLNRRATFSSVFRLPQLNNQAISKMVALSIRRSVLRLAFDALLISGLLFRLWVYGAASMSRCRKYPPIAAAYSHVGRPPWSTPGFPSV